MGAFAAHALKAELPANLLATFGTAVDYQLAHSLAIILIVLLAKLGRLDRVLTFSAWAFSVGIILFSGSLYTLVLTGQSKLGMITPFGGVCFLAGWFSLLIYTFKKAS